MKYQKALLSVLPIVLSIVLSVGCAAEPAHKTETQQTITPEHSQALATEPLSVIWTGSDFQYSDPDANELLVQELIDAQMADGVTQVDYAFLCGDLTPISSDLFTRADSNLGAEKVLQRMQTNWGLSADDCFFLTGNHDAEGYDLNDATGGYELNGCCAYLINHEDYPTAMSYRETVAATAQKLSTWLDEKAAEAYTGPIFVLSHIPLHHSARLDTRNASLIVDALNAAADDGLEIIYLFGHNHSSSYDCYLGGSCVCIEKGSLLPVSEINGFAREHFSLAQIRFTYVNAGYLGYVGSFEPDACLSSLIISVYEDRVELRRYSKDGLCNMRNTGVSDYLHDSGENEDEDTYGQLLWEPFSQPIESPFVIDLTE